MDLTQSFEKGVGWHRAVRDSGGLRPCWWGQQWSGRNSSCCMRFWSWLTTGEWLNEFASQVGGVSHNLSHSPQGLWGVDVLQGWQIAAFHFFGWVNDSLQSAVHALKRGSLKGKCADFIHQSYACCRVLLLMLKYLKSENWKEKNLGVWSSAGQWHIWFNLSNAGVELKEVSLPDLSSLLRISAWDWTARGYISCYSPKSPAESSGVELNCG